MNEQKEFVLIPVIGNCNILFGDASNMKDKMNRLEIFYSAGWSKSGYADYSKLNLKFDNEVYATHRGSEPLITADTTQSVTDTTQTQNPIHQ